MKHLISFILSTLILTGALVVDPAALDGAEPEKGRGKPAATSGTPPGASETAPKTKPSTAAPPVKVVPGPKLDGPAALAMLDTLKIKGKAPATGYNRNAQFGNGWKDFNANKCDERQDTLKRDMSKVKYKDAKKCQLASGVLADSYTGRRINWKVNSGSVDIDHVVALKNVWISGGQQFSQDQRLAVANDPLNLMASQASANRSKADANAAEWLPSHKPFRCRYVAIQISVKKKYALAVTRPEMEAMRRVLNTCPQQKAAKVSPIKVSSTRVPPRPAKSNAAPTKEPSRHATKPTLVSPGAYCAKSDKGTKGIGKKNAKSYTCKTSNTDTRLRWR